MTRRAMLLRSWVLALVLVTVGTVNAMAQGPYPCKCPIGTIYGSDALKCKVKVCVKTASSFTCFTIGPGSVQDFKCDQWASVYIEDCKGNLIEVTEKCTPCICISPDCNVQACLAFDEKGCIYVKVFPC